MASNAQQTIIDALQRAVAHPDGLPLYGSRATPGLFGSSAAAKKSARLCVDSGWLCEQNASHHKQSSQLFVISEKGLAYLVRQTDPKPVLDEIAQSLKDRERDWSELVAAVHDAKKSLDAFQSYVADIQGHIDRGLTTRERQQAKPNDDWPSELTNLLSNWQHDGNLEDCPLPHLYRLASTEIGEVSIGMFQDALRQLYADEVIYLHPWTGPLYELPEPNFAFMIGHEIAYYVSLRQLPAGMVGTPVAKTAYQPC